MGCEVGSNARIQSLTEDARSAQTLSIVSFAAGGALLVGGAVLAFAVPKQKAPSGQTHMRIVPLFRRDGAGVSMEHSF